ncbi:unnamed protein product [Parascedosporium putredinis]|uniref:3-carboxymuconate cyclase n=1 Tax=Parascedosporium putredinis TaxID=1442378 RepID=A0A9P1M8D7_9PEZI|nr:unnamed protein product [Parascedosporium putredinis]CAI7993421.1 unnamed protein product [Parascedosporium putredinis]
MHVSSTSSLLLSILSLANLVTGHPGCRPSHRPVKTAKAIYFLTNEDVNGVVALPVKRDGSLASGIVTETGGAGATSLDANNQPAVPDPLVGQSALTVAGKYLFAVNAGSNTLSMLSISRSDPTKLRRVGEPVALPGEFPNTVAASSKNNLVCVGTTGALAGISCSSFGRNGLGPMDQLRPFDLGQTTPPVGPTNTVSHAFFSDDQTILFTNVKGDPATNKTGFLSAFAVQGSGTGASLSTNEVRSTLDGTAVLFGAQAIPGTSNIFATDAAFGGAVISVNPVSLEGSTVAAVAVEEQVATCWAAISPVTGTAFVADIGAPRLVEMSLADASIISEVAVPDLQNPGLTDLRAGGSFIYALSPGNGTSSPVVAVVSVAGGSGAGEVVELFDISDVAGPRAQGMAVFE